MAGAAVPAAAAAAAADVHVDGDDGGDVGDANDDAHKTDLSAGQVKVLEQLCMCQHQVVCADAVIDATAPGTAPPHCQ